MAIDPGSVSKSAPEISVVVCTYNRPESLLRTVRSLLEQTVRPAEIIVVQNGPPNQATTEALAAVPDVSLQHEPVQGLDFARNRGLQQARGSVVAFLDDDAVAQRDWISSIAAAFTEIPETKICTGRVRPLDLDTPAQRMFEKNGGLSRGDLPVTLPRDLSLPINGHGGSLVAWATRIGVGCNMAVHRATALELGGFDEALDLGPALPGGGDIDMVWRFVASGYTALYRPDIVVQHEHRRDIGAVANQIIGHQRALIAFLTKALRRSHGRTRASILLFLLWRLMKPGLRIVRRLVAGDPLSVSLLLRMWWSCMAGLRAYQTALEVARKRVLGVGAR